MSLENRTSQLGLEERKEIMLRIMKELADYLERNGLRYCLIGGTLIGAIRHKGFIPWDDDMDIGMPMDDYKKFIELTKDKPISDKLYVSSVYNNPDHIWPMTKVIDTSTCLVEPNVFKKYVKRQEKFCGVYVDVFPLYGVPQNERQRRKYCNKLVRLYTMAKNSSRMIRFKDGYGNRTRKIVYSICSAPLRIIGLDYFLNRIVKMVERIPFSEDGYAGFALGIIKDGRDVNPSSMYLDTIDVQFEDIMLKAPREYDSILRNHYGDYMILPPEDKRRIHPGVVTYREG